MVLDLVTGWVFINIKTESSLRPYNVELYADLKSHN